MTFAGADGDDAAGGPSSNVELISSHAPNVIAIVSIALGTEPGDFIPDAAIDEATGVPIMNWIGAMNSAMALLEVDSNISLKRDKRAKGYWHANDRDIKDTAHRGVLRARRRLKREARRLSSIKDFDAMTKNEQQAHVQVSAWVSLLLDDTSKKRQGQIERAVANGKVELTGIEFLLGK